MKLWIARSSETLVYQDKWIAVATVIESLLRGTMRIGAPGDCNHALRQSSGALAVQTGLITVVGDPVDGSSKFRRRADLDRCNTMKPSALIRRLEWPIGNY